MRLAIQSSATSTTQSKRPIISRPHSLIGLLSWSKTKDQRPKAKDHCPTQLLVLARDPYPPLHKFLNVQRHTFSFRLPDEFGIDIDNAHLDGVFNRDVRKPFSANFSEKLGRNLENPHL